MFKKDDIHAGHKINDSGHRGSQGIVHHANRISDNQEVALKLLILNATTPIDYERFKYENVILHKLSPHQNIVSTFSNVSHDGTYAHFTMEFLPQDLMSYAFQFRSDLITFDQKLELAIGICKGLAHAHNKKIFHRDLHYNNIRIEDSSMTAKISDFGLSKMIGSRLRSDVALLAWGFGVRPPEAKFLTSDNPRDDYFRVGDIYGLGLMVHYIFASTIEEYVMKLNADRIRFLILKGIASPDDFETLQSTNSESKRKKMFKDWLKQIAPDLDNLLKIELAEVDRSKKLTKIVKKMCAPNPSERYKKVETIITELESI